MTCHPTDPANPVPEGQRQVPDGTTTKECAGALILIQREMQRLDDEFHVDVAQGWKRYRQANPRGLTREGAGAHAAALMFGGVPLLGGGLEITVHLLGPNESAIVARRFGDALDGVSPAVPLGLAASFLSMAAAEAAGQDDEDDAPDLPTGGYL